MTDARNDFFRAFRTSALDLLYPPKCALCDMLGPEPICDLCFSDFNPNSASVGMGMGALDYAACLFDYTGRAAEAVQRLKYNRLTLLADKMARQLAEGAVQRNILDIDLIVPVPIHWSRRVHRGFNQSELLCAGLPQALVNKGILFRSKATRPQVGLSHAERGRNIEGAFSTKGDAAGMRILLVDDVLTTGGTAAECASVLKQAGAAEVGIVTYAGEKRWRT